jgi:SOS response regulatory protein OraA/RecX
MKKPPPRDPDAARAARLKRERLLTNAAAYIARQIKAGHSQTDIRAALKRQGIGDDDITAAFYSLGE